MFAFQWIGDRDKLPSRVAKRVTLVQDVEFGEYDFLYTSSADFLIDQIGRLF